MELIFEQMQTITGHGYSLIPATFAEFAIKIHTDEMTSIPFKAPIPVKHVLIKAEKSRALLSCLWQLLNRMTIPVRVPVAQLTCCI